MLLLDKQAWTHSAKSFLAAVIALYIGLAADLPRPYWAMTTAYVVLQPVMGGTNSRGIYRIAGTLIASIAVVLFIPGLIQAPIVLSLAMSLWLSGCIFVALLHRGPSSYVFMLAGYTAAFVGFPMVLQPDAIFQTALARSEEIILGSLCAVVVGALVFPASIKPMIGQRVQALMNDAKSWCAQVLAHHGSSDELRRRLAKDLTQLDLILPFTKRDDPRNGDLEDWLSELRARLLGMLPVLASIEDRLDNLGKDATQNDALAQLIGDMRDWIHQDAAPEAQTLWDFRQRIDALRPAMGEDSNSLLRNSLLLRLKELIELWYDTRHLQASIQNSEPPPEPAFGLDLRRLVRVDNRHIDWSMLTFSSLSAGITLFAYCLLWIALGWPEGVSGALMAAVASAFFAAQDDPSPNILSFTIWAIVASLATGIYLFGILPAIHDFVPLIAVLTPTFLLVGLMASRPSLFLPGMILITNMASLLSIQNHSIMADFETYINATVSTIIGLLFALVMTRLFRSVGAEWSAKRLIRQGWRLIAMAAEGNGRQDRERFLVRMLDLLGLLAPRLASLPADSGATGVDMLDEIRIGLNILNLRRARNDLPQINQTVLNQLLHDIAAHYRARERASWPLPPPQKLKTALETSLSRLSTLPPGDTRDEALLGLLGLRIGLFPQEALPGSVGEQI